LLTILSYRKIMIEIYLFRNGLNYIYLDIYMYDIVVFVATFTLTLAIILQVPGSITLKAWLVRV